VFDSAGSTIRRTGTQLMSSLQITIPQQHASELIHYCKVGQ